MTPMKVANKSSALWHKSREKTGKNFYVPGSCEKSHQTMMGLLSMTRTIVLLFSVICSINGLRCYTCTYGATGGSTNTPHCADPFLQNTHMPNVLPLDCANVSRLASEAVADAGIKKLDTCMKTVSSPLGWDVFSRTCYDSSQCPTTNGCFSNAGATICCCNTDLCNGSAALVSELVVVVALVCAVFMLVV